MKDGVKAGRLVEDVREDVEAVGGGRGTVGGGRAGTEIDVVAPPVPLWRLYAHDSPFARSAFGTFVASSVG